MNNPYNKERDTAKQVIVDEDTNILLRGRASELLVKDKLTKSEKDELSEALRPFNKLSVYKKVMLQMQYKNFRPQYNTKDRITSFFLTIILIAVVSLIVYLGGFDLLKSFL
jgi:hypothetical protein